MYFNAFFNYFGINFESAFVYWVNYKSYLQISYKCGLGKSFCRKSSTRYFSRACSIRLKDVLKTCQQEQFNLLMHLEDISKTPWRRLENVLKMSWRYYCKKKHMTRTNIFVLIKTSWRRLHQDECLLGCLCWM